jgi:hypothetical protein
MSKNVLSASSFGQVLIGILLANPANLNLINLITLIKQKISNVSGEHSILNSGPQNLLRHNLLKKHLDFKQKDNNKFAILIYKYFCIL